MADVKISALPAATTPAAGTEVLPIVQSSTTKQISIANLTAGRAVSASSLTLTTPLSVANGGTGLTSLTAGYIPFGAGTSAFNSSANFTWDGSNFNIVSSASFFPQVFIKTTSNDAYGPYLFIGKTRGASAVQVGDYVGTLSYGGADSSGTFRGSSNISAIVTAVGASSIDSQLDIVGIGTTSFITLKTNNLERMRIDSSGNVGIGTSSPNSKLHVIGDAAASNFIIGTMATSDAGTFGFYNSNGPGIGFWGSATGNAGAMLFNTGGSERMRIDSSGNVVVNTAAIATTATDGFLYVPTCAGTPTGTPTTYTGRAPIVVNTTNNKLYFYSGGAWRDAGP